MTTGRRLQGTKLAVVWVLICVICAIAADDLCSEYLISGWNGLTDERITYLKPYGSTSVPEEAPNLRLHADVAWTTDIYEDHYLLQINFTTPKTLHTIVVLSVPNYIYMYRFIPLTGTWTTDWLSPHQYLDHPGSSVPEYYPLGFEAFNTTLINIHVTSKDLQIDFLGCNTADPVDRFTGVNLKSFQFVPLSVEDLPEEGTVIGNNIVTHLDCGKLCFGQKSCVTFSVDTETGQCVGYETNIYGNVLQRERHLQPLLERRSFYFFNFGLTRMLTDYERDITAVLMYRVYTSRKTQHEAALFCSNHSADLLIISTIPQLDSVQTKINSSTVLRHEGPYYVGGSNTTGVWQYGENWTIPDNLWSSSPTTTSGQCVVLTNDGLSSYECDEKLFFICGI